MIPRLDLIALAFVALATPASAFEISSPSVANDQWDAKYLGDKAGCGALSIELLIAFTA